ncbi:O-antigen ligase family protein [Pedobacter punctiformis]|uniref:O-antigen ligase family protein n=1 Tax=Pedobacter punctiformis TaxID=3004097 RepID=A0ABT4L925_9SPHI|nr:O-antigen ligase family protein [Pedobacter sp. HCMS5-2]MCZ4243314.1 O-antigen ligase family protein [Pedobacter sp. HCMS5-2]
MKCFISTISFAVVIMLYGILPSVNSSEMYNGTQSSKFILFSGIVSIIPLLLFFKTSPDGKKTRHFKMLDLFAALLILYISINYFVRKGSNWQECYELLLLTLLYIFLRRIPKEDQRHFILILIVGGAVQAVYANCQLYGLASSNHSIFKVTGSFFNPGPLAGYLTAVFPFALEYVLFSRKAFSEGQDKDNKRLFLKTIRRYILPICLLVIVLALPITKSRAGFMGAGVAIIFLSITITNLKITGWLAQQSTLLKVAMFFFTIGGLYLLYVIKADSADGRIFIWKNTITLIGENFVFGGGHGSFSSRYMNAQGEFFRENPESVFTINASTVTYAFNELLEFWSENGIVGIIILTLLLIQTFSVCNTPIVIACKASLIAILTFSLFSYPFSILPIKLIMIICIAFIASNSHSGLKLPEYNNFNWLKAGILSVVVLAVALNLLYVVKLRKSFINLTKANRVYQTQNYQLAALYYHEEYYLQNQNAVYLLQYGKTLYMQGKVVEAIKILKRAMAKENSVLVQLTLGECYQRIKAYNSSEESYFAAHNMVPNLLYPQYLLTKLYYEQGRKKEANNLAKKLINRKEKIDSPASKEIKKELMELIY